MVHIYHKFLTKGTLCLPVPRKLNQLLYHDFHEARNHHMFESKVMMKDKLCLSIAMKLALILSQDCHNHLGLVLYAPL